MPSTDTRVVTAHLPHSHAAHVERKDRHRKLTLEAMADVDEGKGVSHIQVKAWAASLNSAEPTPLPK